MSQRGEIGVQKIALYNNYFKQFWRETAKSMKINNNDLSLGVDGHKEVKEIANLFANHFGYQPTSNPIPSQAANTWFLNSYQ